MNTSIWLTRAKKICREEGILHLLFRSLKFIVRYQNNHYLLYKCRIDPHNKSDKEACLPKINNYFLKLVSSKQQMDDIEKEGFDISYIKKYTRYQFRQKGMVGFLLFVDKNIAAMTSIAVTEEAKSTFGPRQFKVDFSQGESYLGGSATVPCFRSKNLCTYATYATSEYLAETGTRTMKCMVDVNNIPSQKVIEKSYPHHRVYAQAHLFGIFGLTFWRETPTSCNYKGYVNPEPTSAKNDKSSYKRPSPV